MRMKQHGRVSGRFAPAVAAIALLAPAASAVAQHQPIYGAPPYSAGAGGYVHNGAVTILNNSGTVIGGPYKFIGDEEVGQRAVRWGTAGAAELPLLSTKPNGISGSGAEAVNDADTVAGWAEAFDGSGNALGHRAVRWSAAGVLTPLDIPGPGFLDTNGHMFGQVAAINQSNVVAGDQQRYSPSSGLGYRPVRWDASGAAHVLQTLTADTVLHSAMTGDINGAGTIVGMSEKIVGDQPLGVRAVRWDAGGTAATELAILGARSDGFSGAAASRIIADSTVFGYAEAFDPTTGEERGVRAVRWDAGGTAIHPLEALSFKPDGTSAATFQDANDARVAVGMADAYAQRAPCSAPAPCGGPRPAPSLNSACSIRTPLGSARRPWQ
jgi:hypothetical protein